MAKFSKIFRGKVDNGNLNINTPDVFDRWLRMLGEDQQVEVIVRKPKKKRSNSQNGYYWGVVVDLIAEELGLFPDEVHSLLKQKFLKKDVEVDGKVFEIIRSSKGLDVGEWEDYMSKCRMWANQELDMWIPEPNEVEMNYSE